MQTTLILGYGNPGRADDGLGPKCIEKLELLVDLDNSNIKLDCDYQLTLETVDDMIRYDQVIFIDASINAIPPFEFKELVLDNSCKQHNNFSTHSVSPEVLLKLTVTLYNKCPKAWVMAIRGYEFDKFGEFLSMQADKNLELAIEYLKNKFLL